MSWHDGIGAVVVPRKDVKEVQRVPPAFARSMVGVTVAYSRVVTTHPKALPPFASVMGGAIAAVIRTVISLPGQHRASAIAMEEGGKGARPRDARRSLWAPPPCARSIPARGVVICSRGRRSQPSVPRPAYHTRQRASFPHVRPSWRPSPLPMKRLTSCTLRSMACSPACPTVSTPACPMTHRPEPPSPRT